MLYPLSYERLCYLPMVWHIGKHISCCRKMNLLNLRRRRDLNPRGGFIPLPLSRRVPWTGLGDASQNFLEVSCRNPTLLTHINLFTLRAEGVGFEPTRSVNPFRFSRPVPSATRRALREISFHLGLGRSLPAQST
jgi:hypothetical protein